MLHPPHCDKLERGCICRQYYYKTSGIVDRTVNARCDFQSFIGMLIMIWHRCKVSVPTVEADVDVDSNVCHGLNLL